MHYHIKNLTILTAAAMLVTLVTLPVVAQIDDAGKGKGPGNGDGICDGSGPQYFDPATVETLSGTISIVYGLYCQVGDGNNTGNGMHFLFTADSGEKLYAMTGPFWFMESKGVELSEGERVTFTGSVVAPHGDVLTDHDYLIVTTLTADGATVTLRDEDGLPLWAGDSTGGYYKSPGYKNGTVVTVQGTVLSVRTRTNGANNDAGLELMVRTRDQQKLRVYLGPQYYCEQQGLGLGAGDQVRLRGSLQNRDMVCQQLTTAAGTTYQFRARNGNPLWQR